MKFTDYILNTWVGDRFSIPPEKPRFEHELWNHYDNPSIRTHNNLEGFHSKLKKIVKTSKPNIYKIINVMKKEESKARSLYTCITAGVVKSKPKPESLYKEEKLKNLKLKFELEPVYELSDYLEDCAIFAASFIKKKKISNDDIDNDNEDMQLNFSSN